MTPEQIPQFNIDTASLKLNPKVISDLTPAEEAAIHLLVTPDPINGYSVTQFSLHREWRLAITEQQAIDGNVIAANLDPPFTLGTVLDLNGNRFIGVELINDVILNDTWEDLTPIISTLPITFKSAEEWPTIED